MAQYPDPQTDMADRRVSVRLSTRYGHERAVSARMRMRSQTRSRHHSLQSSSYVDLDRENTASILIGIDALRCMVHDLYLYEYVFEDHPYCASEADYSYDRPICLCLRMVHNTGCFGEAIPSHEADHAILEVRNSSTTQANCSSDVAPYGVHDWRSHFEC